ncbi:MAG: hypothetical protein ACPG8W_24275, partial [Candidatus Promineifilaceae bacterium]
GNDQNNIQITDEETGEVFNVNIESIVCDIRDRLIARRRQDVEATTWQKLDEHKQRDEIQAAHNAAFPPPIIAMSVLLILILIRDSCISLFLRIIPIFVYCDPSQAVTYVMMHDVRPDKFLGKEDVNASLSMLYCPVGSKT